MPVAPASRSAISVIDSSPSNGPSMASPPAAIRARSLAAAIGVSTLSQRTVGSSFAMKARNGTDSVTPLRGASCTMIGMSTAAATALKCSNVPFSSALSSAP